MADEVIEITRGRKDDQTRRRLAAELDRVAARLHTEADVPPVEVAGGDFLDMAQGIERQELARLTATRLAERARRLRLALARMSEGEYGVCSECGATIPPKRLLAVPDATTCVACQVRLERGGKMCQDFPSLATRPAAAYISPPELREPAHYRPWETDQLAVNVDVARRNLEHVVPRPLTRHNFVRAYNTAVKTRLGREYFFDSTWSYERGYRYNFKATHPVLYVTEDPLVAAAAIGSRTRRELLAPLLHAEADPYLYVTVKVTGAFADLTDAGTRALLAVEEDELLVSTEEWQDDMDDGRFSVTQEVGKLVLTDSRFDGILYSSYPVTRLLDNRGYCLALFMDRDAEAMARPLRPTLQLEVVDPGGILAALGLRI